MLAEGIAARRGRRGWHYGWVMAGVTFVVMRATSGAMGSAWVLIGPLQAEFGWATAQISALVVRLLLFGLPGPFAAAMMNAFGLRSVVTLIGGGIFGSFVMT